MPARFRSWWYYKWAASATHVSRRHSDRANTEAKRAASTARDALNPATNIGPDGRPKKRRRSCSGQSLRHAAPILRTHRGGGWGWCCTQHYSGDLGDPRLLLRKSRHPTNCRMTSARLEARTSEGRDRNMADKIGMGARPLGSIIGGKRSRSRNEARRVPWATWYRADPRTWAPRRRGTERSRRSTSARHEPKRPTILRVDGQGNTTEIHPPGEPLSRSRRRSSSTTAHRPKTASAALAYALAVRSGRPTHSGARDEPRTRTVAERRRGLRKKSR